MTEIEGYGLHFVLVIDSGPLSKMLFLNWSILGKLMKEKSCPLKIESQLQIRLTYSVLRKRQSMLHASGEFISRAQL